MRYTEGAARERRRSLSGRYFRLAPLAAAVALASSGAANAATIVVNSASAGSSNTSCTLLDAISAVNAAAPVGGCIAGNGSDDTIDLTGFTSATTITFSQANSGDGQSALALTKPATITAGVGSSGPLVTLARNSSAGNFRVLASSANLNLHGLSITGGNAAARGGGVYVSGTATLTLQNCVVSGNSIANQPYGGGGVAAHGGAITLISSTVSGNSAPQRAGGGVYETTSGTITLTDSTVSGNTAYIGGGVYDFSGDIIATRSTVSGNTSTSHGPGGGGIYGGHDVTLSNSTVANNSALYFGGGVSTYHSAHLYFATLSGNSGGSALNFAASNTTLVSIGSLITANNGGSIYQPSGTFTGSNNIIAGPPAGAPPDTLDCDAKLGPLADNGGPTQTMGLENGSCAIDVGPASVPNGITTDQRGQARPFNTVSDIGAFEKQGPNDPVPDEIFKNGFDT